MHHTYIRTYIHMPVKYQVVSTVEPHVTTTAEIENTYIASKNLLILNTCDITTTLPVLGISVCVTHIHF